MIKFQSQGWNECLPTSLAMCIGVDKNEFIETILLGTPYTFFAEIPIDERMELMTTALRYWGENLWETEKGGDLWVEQVMEPIHCEADMQRAVDAMKQSAGLLTIWNDDRHVGHAVAFDHGLILDPAHDACVAVPAGYWALCAATNGFIPFGVMVLEEEVQP